MCVYLQNLMEAFVPHKLHSVFFDPFLCSVLFCSHFFNYDVFLSLDSPLAVLFVCSSLPLSAAVGEVARWRTPSIFLLIEF